MQSFAFYGLIRLQKRQLLSSFLSLVMHLLLVTSSDGLQPKSDGLQPTSFLLLVGKHVGLCWKIHNQGFDMLHALHTCAEESQVLFT